MKIKHAVRIKLRKGRIHSLIRLGDTTVARDRKGRVVRIDIAKGALA